jgi:outer membrane protein assembly factor BamB
MRLFAIVLVAVFAVVAPAVARDFAPRNDIEIIALDVKTGALKWTHKGTPLGNAHFEIYPGLVAVYPHYDNTDKTKPMLLDPKSGAVVKDTRDPAKRIKASSAQWIRGAVVLANGWRLDGFDAGNTKDLDFTDPKTSKVVWTVKPAHYPEYVLAYKDTLLVAYGYLTDQAMLFGYRAGSAKPAWTIDFNKLLGKPAAKKDLKRLGRVAPQLIGDTLYVQTGEHVFSVAPETGKVAWRTDAAQVLGVKYEPDLYGGALDISVFTRDGDVLVVAFEKRILALNAATGKLRWHMQPDTFPHAAFPLAHDGIVYLSSGPKRGAGRSP